MITNFNIFLKENSSERNYRYIIKFRKAGLRWYLGADGKYTGDYKKARIFDTSKEAEEHLAKNPIYDMSHNSVGHVSTMEYES